MKKPASVVALSASVLAMSTAASFADYTLNILTLGALTIAVGRVEVGLTLGDR